MTRAIHEKHERLEGMNPNQAIFEAWMNKHRHLKSLRGLISKILLRANEYINICFPNDLGEIEIAGTNSLFWLCTNDS